MTTIAYTRYAKDRYNVHNTLIRRDCDLVESRRDCVSLILEDKADSVFSKEAVSESPRWSPEKWLARALGSFWDTETVSRDHSHSKARMTPCW